MTERAVGKTHYVRFDSNDYSVPIELVGQTVTVTASEKRVRILHGEETLADHERTYDNGATVADPEHLRDLENVKVELRKGRVKDRLMKSAPSVAKLYAELADRGANLGAVSKALLRLLDDHGAQRLDAAVKEALERKTPEPESVRMILERHRLEAGLEPKRPVALPDDPRVRNLAVRPATLEQYGRLGTSRNETDGDLTGEANEATEQAEELDE